MTQKIEIPVEAKLNAQGVEQAAKRLDKALSDSGRRKIDPVPDAAVKKLEALFDTYKKLDREMSRRLNVTGQKGKPLADIDWEPVYQNQKTRAAKLRQLQSFLRNGGGDFEPPQQPGHGGGGFARGAANIAAGAAQAGMRAAGPVGGVAANALGSGMSAGFGAGLMGLVGGLAALGVGKLVGAITEKIEQAENNNIAYDRLKRTLGDVNVSFAGLKAAVMKTGEGLNVTYDESERLASMFAKQGKLSGDAYKSLPEELGIGVGMSRAYGLDPSQGVGILGQMRGIGVTRDTQDSRRFALLIGETIAKSDAFAKADEVMEALANFATTQTRQSMVAANVQGYAGMFSSMVGSGIPGMDPAGASGMLSRMNAALSAGGAKGEASQFFTAAVANRMGLDPLQMQVLREGGMFASKDQMFGVGSAYTRYMGQTGPTGSQDFLSATRALIEQQYAGDSETQKLLRAQAFGNHTGLNMNQAMAMLSLQPNQMGELQQYAGDMSKLSASGINNMAIARFGTDAQRAGLARTMLGRDDVSQSDKDRISAAMASGSTEQQKEVLAKLSAQYEQERTTGSDIRDSRAALDNIKTKMADQVVPTLLDIKKGILYMAGVRDGKTPQQMMAEVDAAEKKDRDAATRREKQSIIDQRTKLGADRRAGRITQEEYDAGMASVAAREKALSSDAFNGGGGRFGGKGASGSWGDGAGGARSGGAASGNPGTTSAAMKFFMDKGWSREQAAGIVANLNHESNMRPNAVGDGGKAYGIAQWHPDRQRNFERWAGKSIRDSSVEEQMAFVHYEMTEGKEKAAGDRLKQATSASDAGAIVSKYYERPLRREAEASARGASADRIHRTPLPEAKSNQAPGAGAGRGSAESYGPLSISAGSIEVLHKNERGQEVQPSQSIPVKVGPANPDTYTQSSGASGSW